MAEEVYSREEYAMKEFWESRYREKEGYFDWYAEFPELKETFETQYGLNTSNNVLMLGCGNSKLSEQMYEAGYHDILNIDISEVVINQMKKVSEEKGQNKMRWEVMDATNMVEVKDKSFDCVIDKGTLDALISGKNLTICEKMLQESMRVLKDDGQMILITYGSPEGRKRLFQASLGFDNYDYYVTRVDLSTLSTLINLMRSNLGGKPLNNIMQDKKAMAKSVLQYNLIQMLRKNKKAEKSFIIWKKFMQKDVVFNEQVSEKQEEKVAEKVEKVQEPKKESQQPKQSPQQQQEQKEEQSKKVTYNPKKQCYCYVYSIKHKFASDFDKVVAGFPQSEEFFEGIGKIQPEKVFIEGEQELDPIYLNFNKNKKFQKEVASAIYYIKKKNLPMNPVHIYRDENAFLQKKGKAKITILEGEKSQIPIYNKTIVKLEIATAPNKSLGQYEEKLKEIGDALTEKLNLHPDGREYAFMGVIMHRVGYGTMRKFLKQYWYPTWKVVGVEERKLIVQMALPPKASFQDAEPIIRKNLGKCDIKLNIRGFHNMIDPRIFAVFNMGSIVYNDGDEIPLNIQDFPDVQSPHKFNSPSIIIQQDKISRILAHFFCSF